MSDEGAALPRTGAPAELGHEIVVQGDVQPLSPVEATLRDPWFSVPATAIFFLHFARDGLNQIEEEPDSLMTTVTLFMPVAVLVVGLVTLAVSRARRRRREGAMVVRAGSVDVTGDVGGPEA